MIFFLFQMEPLSENSREALKETVFQLITHNQQFEALTKEVCCQGSSVLKFCFIFFLCPHREVEEGI